MTDIYTPSNYFLQERDKGRVNFESDVIRILCMKEDFVFNKRAHNQLKNIRTNTGSIALVWSSLDRSVTRTTGSFITDGFVATNQCTSTDTSNPGPLTIYSVTASKIIFNDAIVDSSATKILSSDDELATVSGGYTQNSKSVGVLTVGPKDDVHDRCDTTGTTISYQAVSASIGPTPGVIFYDVTSDVIIGYLEFAASKTISPPNALNVGGVVFRSSNL